MKWQKEMCALECVGVKAIRELIFYILHLGPCYKYIKVKNSRNICINVSLRMKIKAKRKRYKELKVIIST